MTGSLEYGKPGSQWESHTITYGERSLNDYERGLAISRIMLAGLAVLDLGSGEQQLFARQLQRCHPTTNVVSFSPAYKLERHSQKSAAEGRVAGIGQRLPFRTESFDVVTALLSITNRDLAPENAPQDARRWAAEITRVLKPGGCTYLAPFDEDRLWSCLPLIVDWKKQGLDISYEPIKPHEFWAGPDSGYEDGLYRIAIQKPLPEDVNHHKEYALVI